MILRPAETPETDNRRPAPMDSPAGVSLQYFSPGREILLTAAGSLKLKRNGPTPIQEMSAAVWRLVV